MRCRPVILCGAATLLAAVVGCQPVESPPTASSSAETQPPASPTPPQSAQQQALAARDALAKQLSTRLIEAMSQGGPAAAIEVCSREAPKIAAAVAAANGVQIGRTSFKLRNPNNAPPSWAQSLIEQRSEQAEFVSLPDGATGALLPIKLQPQCLACHGPAEQISPEVREKLAALYPDDQAKGFQEGDLRGWFWVVVQDAGSQAADGATASPQELFAQFDEVYIPALALTQQQQAERSQTALDRLANRWTQLRLPLASVFPTDARWPHDLETIDATIGSSTLQVRAGELAAAHESLEAIRDLLMQARTRQSSPYALDSLSDFHTVMEAIVKPATKLTPETISNDYIEQLQTLVETADKKWKIVEATSFPLELFEIDPAETVRLQQFIAQERAAITALRSALASGDRASILPAATALKPPFAKAYMFFGDFPQ